MYKDELIFDIETDSLDVSTNNLRYFGAYSYKTNGFYFYSYNYKDKIQQLIQSHRVLVNHNIKGFDTPSMMKFPEFSSVFAYKVLVDTLEIARSRINHMVNSNKEKIHAVRFNLNEVHKKLFPEKPSKITDFNYEILKKDVNLLTDEEKKQIKEYTMRDVVLVKDVFDEFCKQFYHYKDLLNAKNQMNYKWLTRKIGSYAYSAFCNLLKIKEEYIEDKTFTTYPGGWMIEPRYEKFVDDTYILDITSQYPHNFFQFNLFSPSSVCSCGDICKHQFNSNKIFQLINTYCTKEIGEKEKKLKELYLLRKKYKDLKDEREAPLKVLINSIYGISAKPTFSQVYYPNRASDCCTIGRQTLQFSDDFLLNKGYLVGYGFTDSLMVKDRNKDKQKMLSDVNELVEVLKENMPFPSETFGFGCTDLSAIWFFKRQMYMYVTKDNKLKIKGLPIIKDSATKLSYHILNNYMKDIIINERNIKFNKTHIMKWMKESLESNMSLASVTFNISDIENHYNNDSSLQKQIKDKYGSGKIELVKNYKYGIGKSVKYCDLEKAKKLNISDLDLETCWRELEPFTIDNITKRITDYVGVN